ncbi:MAG TPA: TIM barrel protein [Streptosporangiaceae bacterium]|nr:TIM barrel protein [Streptosporangiaceae bacterium]
MSDEVRSRLRIGTAPDSWGVWFADDPRQLPWQQFLDEAAESGYQWIELGPYGYLPTDPSQLRDELGQRGLSLSGGAVPAGLHRGQAGLDEAIAACRAEAELLTALGASHLVLLPEQYTDVAGNLTQPAELDADQWRSLLAGADELAAILDAEFGVALTFHPHADSHVETQDQVERFLEGTDPGRVLLCLDTGHISYRGGDNLAIISKFGQRMGYVHLKQVDPAVIARVDAERLPFPQAVRLGAMVEPPLGEPPMEPLLAALGELDADLFAIVEQDLFPCRPDVPLPIATRTLTYYASCGLGPARR